MKAYSVAIVGATGAVGTQMLQCLEGQEFPVGSLKLLASPRSAGKVVATPWGEIGFEQQPPRPSTALTSCSVRQRTMWPSRSTPRR